MSDLSAPLPIDPIRRLAVKEADARRMLGGISRTSLWRLEKCGYVTALPGMRTKLYSIASIEAYVRGEVVPRAQSGGDGK